MIILRQQHEANEAQALAPYGIKSRDSKGRAFPEEEDPYRTAFQRDRDRIIHTTAFRRLEYKTQVFVNYEGDYYRTRLTHTLEVVQIGRSLALSLGANADLVEGICLAHDLGHSPFGHAGEHVLNELMSDHGGFDHNRQTYRIVTELEHRYPGWVGLNLTHELLEGIVKHETEYDLSSSYGYDVNTRGSLEAQIANVADELAYNAHDLDDGLRASFITYQQLADLDIWRMVRESIGWDGLKFDDLIRYRMIRRLIGLQIDGVTVTTDHRLQEAKITSVEMVQQQPANIVGNSEIFVNANRQLKTFLYDKLYHHFRVMRMSAKAHRFLSDLFEAYTTQPSQLPPETQARIDTVGLHRAVADYLAGMTDRYALQEWQRLFDPFTRP